MLGKHPNKPTEKRLIEYIKGIIEEWVLFLIDPVNTGCLLGDTFDPDNNKCVNPVDVGENLIEERNKCRSEKDFKRADQIRNELKKNGIEIEDSSQGTTWRSVK